MSDENQTTPSEPTPPTTIEIQAELADLRRELERERESKERILAESKEYKRIESYQKDYSPGTNDIKGKETLTCQKSN